MDCFRAFTSGLKCTFRRTRRVRLALASLCCIAIATPCAIDAAEVPAPAKNADAQVGQVGTLPTLVENFRHDASLADVNFIDRTSGWAVGDRGVIWHTGDGGATWRQQVSGVSCALGSVFFINANRGWAVGGECRPYSQSTQGVVLRTHDGGKTWISVPGLTLPRLKRVKFFDEKQGIALGDATSVCPAGVFVTQDAGQSWQPLPADETGHWNAGDFLDFDGGAVAGEAGKFATLAQRKVVVSPLSSPSLRSFHAMRLVAPTGGWLVGDGGLVLTTRDLGRSWQSPPTEIPESAADNFDFHAVAICESHVWIAGAPGSRVLHSPDGGQTWESFATGQTAPLRSLSFIDADHGWAAGDFGNILVTQDGGRTWKVQRSGGGRAALLGIFAGAADVPLELLADAGASEGYLAAIEVLHVPADHTGAAGDRTREAMLQAGASAAESAWRFPLPSDELALSPPDLLAELNRANDGRAIVQLERHLVRMIRTWRPDVIVTHHAGADAKRPMAALAEQLVMKAVSAAADPAWNAEMASDVGLAPWQVKKVFGVLPPGMRGDEVLATGRFSPWLGAAICDFVASARRLLDASPSPPPDAYELKLLASQGTKQGGPPGLFSGVLLSPGCEARRQQADLPANDLDHLRQLATRRRHLAELLERSEGNAAWAGQVANLTADLPAADGAELLVQLADGYRVRGRLDLAADTYYLFSRRYPDHPLVDQALAWLVRYYASSEAAQSSTSRGAHSVRQTVFEESDSAAPAVGLSRDDRLRRAIQLVQYLKTARPALYSEPSIRFAELAAQRQLGFANPAKRYFLTLRNLPKSDPWRECAETEQWLSEPADLPPPKVFGACRPTKDPPHLDGELVEPIWATADPLRLRDAEDQFNRHAGKAKQVPEVRLAYDQEFLYLAVRCPKVFGGNYERNDSPRPRDADLSQFDRVTLQLDVDRDFTTAFELTVDSRGWTRDTCLGDVNWNPTWYVAAGEDDMAWTIEAAVPLAELVAEPPAARHVWAVAARRTIPRVGYQSWTGDSANDGSPRQFGLLIFE